METTPSYQWEILKAGRLPLRPDGTMNPLVEHVCTVTLVWPAGQKPDLSNSLIVDPCLSTGGVLAAGMKLNRIGILWHDIGFSLVLHDHFDHAVKVPGHDVRKAWKTFIPGQRGPLSGIRATRCPGHDPSLLALSFRSAEGHVWVVSDAVLDEEWLTVWGYYWPNGYGREEIVETWRSVATIISHADIVIPGHGDEITVTPGLIEEMIDGFPEAEYAEQCPDVVRRLEERLAGMR